MSSLSSCHASVAFTVIDSRPQLENILWWGKNVLRGEGVEANIGFGGKIY